MSLKCYVAYYFHYDIENGSIRAGQCLVRSLCAVDAIETLRTFLALPKATISLTEVDNVPLTYYQAGPHDQSPVESKYGEPEWISESDVHFAKLIGE